MSKRQLEWSITTAQLTCRFAATETEEAQSLTFNTGALPGEIGTEVCSQLMTHGLKQKLADSVSGMVKKGYGVMEQRKLMAKTWKALVSGKWSVRKPGEKKISQKELTEKLAKVDLTQEQMDVMRKLGLL